MSVAENIARVREQIKAAATRSGRNPDDITLMAVTKTVSPERIREAYHAGIREFGENRVQEFAGKQEALRGLADAQWHMIGHLQSNKAAGAVDLFDAIDSIDSLRLARKINAAAQERGKKLAVLLEINIGGESAKAGLAPDSRELQNILRAAPELASLEVMGLMTVPPYDDDPEASRGYFRRMRALFAQIEAMKMSKVRMEVLSMGMSHDFRVAIGEGSTCVRVGTAIFGERSGSKL
jgi:pyridoxal phosphate enzyme (YggS family)